jgi:hypothetical protein
MLFLSALKARADFPAYGQRLHAFHFLRGYWSESLRRSLAMDFGSFRRCAAAPGRHALLASQRNETSACLELNHENSKTTRERYRCRSDWVSSEQEFRLAMAAPDSQTPGRPSLSLRKPAKRAPARAHPPTPAATKPCMPLTVRPIQLLHRSAPRHGFAWWPGARCADLGCGYPSPPSPNRSAMRASERIAAMHCPRPVHRTSPGHPWADLPPECCCRRPRVRKKCNPIH